VVFTAAAAEKPHETHEVFPSSSVIRNGSCAFGCPATASCFHVTFLSVVELHGDCTIIMHDIKLGVCPYACQSVKVCEGGLHPSWILDPSSLTGVHMSNRV